jgi:ATP/ADP translocase
MTVTSGERAAKAIDVRPQEWASLGWSFAMFFAVLASYFTVRPVREMMGASLGNLDMWRRGFTGGMCCLPCMRFSLPIWWRLRLR